MFVHREGVNPNSMDGVNDLRDHRSFRIVQGTDKKTLKVEGMYRDIHYR